MEFNGLYEVQYQDDTVATIKLSDEHHPIFKAHFPDQPILPGFMHFEIVTDIFNLEINNIKRAKFTQIVLPNQVLKYERQDNKFKVYMENSLVASFSI